MVLWLVVAGSFVVWLVYLVRGHKKAQAEWHRQYGPIVGYFFGYDAILLINDSQILKNVLLRDFMNFTDRSELLSGGGNGSFDLALTNLKGQRWKEVRSTLTPSFTTSKLKQLSPEIVKIADEFMENVDKAYASGGRSVEMYDLYQALTAETICRTAMGVDFGMQKDIEGNKLLRDMKVVFQIGLPLPAIPFISFPSVLRLFAPLMQKIIYMSKNKGKNPLLILKRRCTEVVKMRRINAE
ncbi:thromboxane-A synthase-like, partial [Tropilaelaps mercedesae]